MKPNHLIIGLGGTGGKVIRSFVKTIKRNERTVLELPVNIQYLYVDSSREMMSDDDHAWKVLGENVQLKPANQLHLDGSQVAAMLKDPYSYQGVKRWIGDPQQWHSIITLGSGGSIVGGQKRRVGRLLFAAKIRDFLTMVDGLVKELTSNNTSAVTIHICCGLAGGTGSGALIDAICQLRRKFPEGTQHKILLYLVLPDRFPKAGWDQGNYHANGYAALLELNALGAGFFNPFDITGEQERVDEGSGKDAPFQACYLMTNENENGLVLDVDRGVPNTLSAFLYEKIVAAETLKYDNLNRHESFENRNLEPEGVGQEKARCRKFIAFGINQLVYPEHEITEFFTYRLADQAALQMNYNRFTSTEGYVDEPDSFDVQTFIQNRISVWKLDIQSLQLEQPVFGVDRHTDEKSWRRIHDDWADFVNRVRQDITSDPSANWIQLLSKQCLERYTNHFRGLGVEAFYEDKRRAKSEFSREMITAVQTDLLSAWKEGTVGCSQVLAVLDGLAEYLIQITRQCAETQVKATGISEEREEKLKANFGEWQDVGPLSRLFKKHEVVFEAAASNLTSYYENRTLVAASVFASELVMQVRGGLMELKAQLQRFSARLQETHEIMSKRAASRCGDKGEDFDTQIVRLYNPDTVREVVRKFCADRTIQLGQTAKVRGELISRRGNETSMETLANIGTDTLCDMLEATCSCAARDLHLGRSQELLANGESILGLSVIDKLEQRYQGNPDKMRQEITKLVERSTSFVPFDNSEALKTGPGVLTNSQIQNRVRSLLILHPYSSDKATFLAALQDAFRSAWKSGGDGVQFITAQDGSANTNNGMTILSLASLFPLRFVHILSVLQEKYMQLLNSSDPKKTQLELHIEGDGLQHPALFIPTVLEQGLPMLLLGLASEVIKNDASGMSMQVMQFDSENRPTVPKRVTLGVSVKGFMERLSEGTVMEDLIRYVEDQITQKLHARTTTIDDFRELLIRNCETLRQQGATSDKNLGRALNDAINIVARLAVKAAKLK